MTRISVFTPTRGQEKLPYLEDALRYLQRQTMADWEWHVLDNNERAFATPQYFSDPRVRYVHDNEFDRSQVHPMPYLLNKYYPQAQGDLIFYLSDDDLLHPDAFATFVKFFDGHPRDEACWVSLQHWKVTGPLGQGRGERSSWIKADGRRGPGTLDNHVDGGQVCHRKRVLDRIEKPWFPESAVQSVARHCDGQFLEKVAAVSPFVPTGDIDTAYVIHRFTPVSTFTTNAGQVL